MCFKGNWVINFHWIDVVVYSVSENLFSSNFVEKKTDYRELSNFTKSKVLGFSL